MVHVQSIAILHQLLANCNIVDPHSSILKSQLVIVTRETPAAIIARRWNSHLISVETIGIAPGPL